jgi:hypothetical protein
MSAQPYCEPDWYEPAGGDGVSDAEMAKPDDYIEPEQPAEWAKAHTGHKFRRPNGRTVYTVTGEITLTVVGKYRHIKVFVTRWTTDRWTGEPIKAETTVPYADIRHHMERVQ